VIPKKRPDVKRTARHGPKKAETTYGSIGMRAAVPGLELEDSDPRIAPVLMRQHIM
jgi:hypothetical protein